MVPRLVHRDDIFLGNAVPATAARSDQVATASIAFPEKDAAAERRVVRVVSK